MNMIRIYKCLLVAVFSLILTPLFSQDMVHVYYIERENQIDFYADSMGLCPYQLYVNFESEKIRANMDLPYYSIIKANEKSKYLFSVFNRSLTQKDLKFYSRVVIGDPENVHEDLDYPYILPYEENTERRVSQGYNGGYSHKGWQKYSLDLGMPIGTPVCAARDGVIVDIKQDSTKGGRSYKYISMANYITVYHSDGTVGQYVHLMPFGSLFEIGTKVTQGQIIGYSGNTGRTGGPHLHFVVSKPVYLARQSLPVKFIDKNGVLTTPKARKYYYSFHESLKAPGAGTNDEITDDIFMESGAVDGTNLGGLE